MATDDIGIGGDNSVKWTVDVHDFREDSDESEAVDGGWHQEGIAETDDGEYYTVAIRLPKSLRKVGKERTRFLKMLAKAVLGLHGHRIVIKVPIEQGNMRKNGKVDQIRISWPSRRRRKED
jgi:hypothetical protein